MANRDLYKVLGVTKSASADDIRKAYRKLARQYHPDVNKSADASKRFNEVQEAYDILSDETKRKQYDQFGRVGGPDGAPAGAGGRPGGAHYTWTNVGGGGGAEMDMEDLSSMFDAFFGKRGGAGFGPEGPFGAARTSRRGRPAGRRGPESPEEALTRDLSVDFMTSVRGGTQQLRVVMGEQNRTIDVTIPKGVRDGAKLRVRGGADGERDLFLNVRIGSHPLFRRGNPEVDGGSPLDLYVTLPLTIAEATLGGPVTVPTLDGPVELTIPPGTASGLKLRLKGRGVDDGTSRGELYAVVKVVPPDGRELTDGERAFLTKLTGRFPSPRTGPQWRSATHGKSA